MIRRLGQADALLAGACLVWGVNFVVVKSALDEFTPLVFNGLRFSAAAGILLWVQWRRDGLEVLRPALPRLIAVGLIGNLVYQLLFIFGLDNTQASQAGLFSSTTPLWVLLLAALARHDKFDRRVVTGALLASAGVTLLLWESFYGAAAGERFWVGNLMLLGASASWAVYTVYSQPLLSQMGPLALTSAAMVAGAVPLLLIAMPEILATNLREISAASWGGLLYSAAMALVFGYLAWSRGIQLIGPARTSIYVNLIPVAAAATAWVWLDERLSPRQLAGAATVIMGIALSRRLAANANQ